MRQQLKRMPGVPPYLGELKTKTSRRTVELPEIVQLALGHSTPMITLNTYAHEWPNALDRTRTLVDAALGSRPSTAAIGTGQ
ncbi:MAG: hypothetical protein JO309_00785 [Pseudonocardiales bacterium]|nr:hypothetical protein [Pseudonocardiales bacterium]